MGERGLNLVRCGIGVGAVVGAGAGAGVLDTQLRRSHRGVRDSVTSVTSPAGPLISAVYVTDGGPAGQPP